MTPDSEAADPTPREDIGALVVLDEKADAEGRIMVESPHRALKGLRFCAKGEPSAAATRRNREMRAKLGAAA